MIIPQYSFKLGTQYNKYGKEGRDSLLLLEHSAWNPSNGEWFEHPDERATSTIMMIGLKSRYLYLDVNITQDKGSYVVFYAEDGSFLSTYWLSASTNKKPILTPEGAKYFALTFSIEDPGLSAYVKDVYTQDKDLYTDFVYSIEDINPIYKKLSKKIEKEANQEFFREALEGELVLTGEDYPKVAGASLEAKFILLIFHKETSEITNFFTGYFTKVNCSLDYAKRSCSIKLPKEDMYTSLLVRYEEVQDLYKLGVPTNKVALTKRPAIQLYIAGSSKVTTALDGTYWEGEVTEEQIDEEQLDKKYHFVWNNSFNEFILKTGYPYYEELAYFAGSFNNGEHAVYDSTGKYKCRIIIAEDPGLIGVHYRLQVIDTETDNILYVSQSPFIPNKEDRFELNVGTYALLEGIQQTVNIEVLAKNAVYARVICDVSTFTDLNGVEHTTYNIPLEDFVLDSRNYKKCYGINFGELISAYATSVKPTKYGKNDFGLYFSKPIIQLPENTNVIPLDRSQWVNTSVWYKFSEAYPNLDKALSKKYYLKDAYHIADAIQAILRKVAPGVVHKAEPEYSEFLYGSVSDLLPPLGMTLFITQKTNALKGEYDQAAQRAETTLEDILGMLQKCFKCYFWVENNKLRIEHISWFNNGGSYIENSPAWSQLNLVDLQDKFNRKPILFYQSELRYDSLKVPFKYSFGYADEQTEIFNGVSMEVVANYVDPTKTEDITVSNFAVDFDYMLVHPSGFSEEGFALIGAQLQNGEYVCPIVPLDVEDEDGNMYRLTVQNGYFSWPKLLRYYMYDLPALTIKGQYVKDLTPHSLTKFMQQEISIPKPRNFDYKQAMRTYVGVGSIQSVSIDLDSNMLTLSLTYQAE